MISEKWRTRFLKTGRVLAYAAAVVYLLALYDKIASIESNIASLGVSA